MYQKKRNVRRHPKKTKVTYTRKVARQEARKVVSKNIETKHFYARFSTLVNINSAGSVFDLFVDPNSGTVISQGTGRSQYIGDTVKPVRIGLRFIAEANSLNYNVYTVMLLQVKGGGIPAPANILQSAGNLLTPLSYIDSTYGDTFRVLARKTFTIQNNGNGTISKYGTMSVFGKALRNVHFVTPANIASANGLFLAIYTDSAVGTAIGCEWEVAYKDA